MLGNVIGIGNIMVELCSADMEFNVCRYRNWNNSEIISRNGASSLYWPAERAGTVGWPLQRPSEHCWPSAPPPLLSPAAHHQMSDGTPNQSVSQSVSHLSLSVSTPVSLTVNLFIIQYLSQTFALASLAASASVAMALWRWTGSRTSLLEYHGEGQQNLHGTESFRNKVKLRIRPTKCSIFDF